MTNALAELYRIFKDVKLTFDDIVCASIQYGPEYWETWNDDEFIRKYIDLKLNYSKEDLHTFLNELNFEYDDGLGSQELFGYIWLTEYRWFERYEYDGAEDWHLKQYPEIPDKLCLK